MSSTGPGTVHIAAGRMVVAAAALALGLVGCSEPVATDSTGVTAEDLRDVQDKVAELEDRLTIVEDQLADNGPAEPVEEPDPPAAEDSFFDDPASSVGEQVTVRGEVMELVASTDIGSAFRIAGDSGEPVAVVSVTPPPEVAAGDVVEVSGSAVEVAPDTFEADFGIAADALFENPEAWLADAEGQVAIAAVRIEVLPASAGD